MAMPQPAPPVRPRRWTISDLERLPDDGNRYEIIDGALFVTPAPSLMHQRAAGELYSALRAYVEEHRLGEVFFAPADLEFASDTMVEPDLMVLPVGDGPLPRRRRAADGVLLAIEILSPGSAHADRQAKRRLYQRERIPEYWVVDLDSRLVERWRPDDERPEILIQELTWRPHGGNAAFELPLAPFFGGVWGDRR